MVPRPRGLLRPPQRPVSFSWVGRALLDPSARQNLAIAIFLLAATSAWLGNREDATDDFGDTPALALDRNRAPTARGRGGMGGDAPGCYSAASGRVKRQSREAPCEAV